MQNGYVTPGRTTLVASSHRIYATIEKMQMGDGRFPEERVLAAARELARRAVLFDMRRVAEDNGTVINAVLFGALAGTGALPLAREACEAAIRASGKGAQASLRGFDAGYAIAAGERPASAAAPRPLPPETREILELGEARLRDYQGEAYARLYRERVASLGEADAKLVGEVGRELALWMSYEDIIRVADLKTRADRFARVRREVGAKPQEPVIVIDHLKPGVEEAASLLPPALGRRLIAWAQARGKLDAYNVGMKVKTSGVLGYLLVRALAGLRPWRPRSLRYAEEQSLIERWLAAVRGAAARSTPLALEIAACAGLLKGYGETHRRGRASFLAILDALVENPPTGDPAAQAAAIRRAREAALADPEHKALAGALGRPVTWLRAEKAR
ncbi:MAG: indolepyruvate oxidoreductase subunit beta family protein, partial [Burkholderiales bacterium]